MRLQVICLIICLFYLQPSYCQTKAKIADVDFHIEDRYIVVNYTLTGTLPNEQMTIELRFITESNNLIIPKTLTGDLGTGKFNDGSKAILWDLIADSVLLSENIKAVVNIKSSKILYHGPSNAFLSVILPGLGGYFVDENKTRSVLTTVSALGFIGYGVSQKILADKYYADYKGSSSSSDIQDLYDKANKAQQNFQTSTTIAAGIWALDIIWVTLKGFHNIKVAKNAYGATNNDRIRIFYVNNGMQLVYKVSF
jgi:hypothetical protein